MNKHVQKSIISSADESRSLNCPLVGWYVQLQCSYSLPEQRPRPSSYILNVFPIPIPLLSVFLFLDLLASAEIREETQPQSITGTFQAPGPSDNDINTYEGGLKISRDRRLPAIEDVHPEVPATNGMTALPNSKDFMSSVMFSESSEEIEPERTTVESSWPHRFTSASALATNSTQLPGVGNTAIEGQHLAMT